MTITSQLRKNHYRNRKKRCSVWSGSSKGIPIETVLNWTKLWLSTAGPQKCTFLLQHHFTVTLMRCCRNLTYLHQLAEGKTGFVVCHFTYSHRTINNVKWSLTIPQSFSVSLSQIGTAASLKIWALNRDR